MQGLSRAWRRSMIAIRLWIRSIAWWLLARIRPIEDELDVALKQAFAACGLNVSDYSPEFDLEAKKKMYDVLVKGNELLGRPRLRTVQDAKDLLR